MKNLSVGCGTGVLFFAIVTLTAAFPQISSASSTVAITSPASGASVSGKVTVVAAIGAGVWWAKLYVDGNGIAVSPPYTFSWNSASVGDGTHSISIAAFSKGGRSPLSTSTINVVVANNSASTVHFSTLAAHSALPSGSQCAGLIESTAETMPANAQYNTASVIPSASTLSGVHSAPIYNETWVPTADFSLVDGSYSGSTDMILRWAACKWGVDEDVVRAQAWMESGWFQNDVGDWRTDLADCERGIWNGWTGSGCYQSHGILEIKLYSFNTYPEAITSTAFNADFRMAYQRACMNGDISYLADQTPSAGYPAYGKGSTDQMLWGCIGDWYSGNWYDSDAINYIASVKAYFASKPWPN